jgi:hypothetical protein
MVDADELQELFSHLMLYFLVAHEYTHHVHLHVDSSSTEGLWTEFQSDTTEASMTRQAQEIDADSYALFLVLAHILRGGARAAFLQQLKQDGLSETAGDELLLQVFFLVAMAFFCELWRRPLDTRSVRKLSHPIPPVRIKYTIQTAQMWCEQNHGVPQTWFEDTRFQGLFHAASEVIEKDTRKTWDSDMAFFKSAEGAKYEEELFTAFENIRRGGWRSDHSISSSFPYRDHSS